MRVEILGKNWTDDTYLEKFGFEFMISVFSKLLEV